MVLYGWTAVSGFREDAERNEFAERSKIMIGHPPRPWHVGKPLRSDWQGRFAVS